MLPTAKLIQQAAKRTGTMDQVVASSYKVQAANHTCQHAPHINDAVVYYTPTVDKNEVGQWQWAWLAGVGLPMNEDDWI